MILIALVDELRTELCSSHSPLCDQNFVSVVCTSKDKRTHVCHISTRATPTPSIQSRCYYWTTMRQTQYGVLSKRNDGWSKDPGERANVGCHLSSDRLQYSFSLMRGQREKEITDTSSCSIRLLSDMSSLGRRVNTINRPFSFTLRVHIPNVSRNLFTDALSSDAISNE